MNDRQHHPGDKQRWAVIGTGTISRSVVPDIMACAGVEVVVVQSRNAEKAAAFAAEHGIPASTDSFDDVLADPGVGALYLATPFATHFEMTRRAILAGKHVLVEKPMATSASEVEELFALAAQHRVFLMEGMWMKFNPAFQRLRAELSAGRIGDVRSVRAAFGLPFPQDGGSRWDLARSGGTLLDQGIYPVTLAHSIFGEPHGVHAAGVLREDGLDLAEHFTLEFADGRYAQCASAMTEFTDRTASIGGARGIITLKPPFWATTSLAIQADDYEKIFVAPEEVTLPKEGNGYVPMVREVVTAINDGLLQHPLHTAEDTLSVFRTLDEITKQLRAGSAGAAETPDGSPRLTAGSMVGDWLDDPVGGPLFRELLLSQGDESGMMAMVRGFSLRRLVAKSDGALSRSAAVELVRRATGVRVDEDHFDEPEVEAGAGVTTEELVDRHPHLAGVLVEDVKVQGPYGLVETRLYSPTGPEHTNFVWVHGGGFVSGDLNGAEAHWVALELAAKGIRTLSVDYRKALGGVSFPIPSDDVLAAWRWAAQNLAPGGDLHLGGASAGAALAAALPLRLADGGERLPVSVVLIYPLVHPRLPRDGELAGAAWRIGFTDEAVEAMNLNFVGAAAGFEDPHAFAGVARDLSGYPATFILNSEMDSLRASGEAFGAQLAASGVEVLMDFEPGTIHGHLSHPYQPTARASVRRMGRWLAER